MARRSAPTLDRGAPLRWLMTVRSGPGTPSAPTRHLIADAIALGRALDRVGLRITAAITTTVDAPLSVQRQVLITAYGLNAARAGRLLLRSGYARASESQTRALLESFVVVESLHGDDQFAEAWAAAATRADRGAFEYAKLKKRSKVARDFAAAWDSINTYVHTNPAAGPTISRMRTLFGYDLLAGPFYDPVPIASLLGALNGVHAIFLQWLCTNLVPAPRRARLQAALDRIGPEVSRTSSEMSHAARELAEPAAEEGQSIAEQRRAVAFVARKVRVAGRRDMAVELLGGARVRSHAVARRRAATR